ncbi:hypothetical protein AB0O22_05990 [Streptomyces sp. NPDC091204]|uniref:hypothetical protein n=1 Tax=Streptomyces sp. NPDC091204 TaxID=3155299 RepID=UPI00342A47BB
MAGPLASDGAYAGDICRALDLATGDVLTEHVLPSFSATYPLQQYPDARPEFPLTASMAQDGAHCLLVTSTADELDIRAAGTAEERVFVGFTPGFVDKDRILVVAAEEQWAEQGTHLLLDARTLEPVAALDYPQAPGATAVPSARAHGSPHDQGTVQRWTTARPWTTVRLSSSPALAPPIDIR